MGSLDRNGHVSSYSNYGVNADVFALGRNHVNAYPDGDYVCRETPDKEDERKFRTGLARWSGTSFSAPLVAGLLAAAIAQRQPGQTARHVKDAFILAHPKEDVGHFRRIRRVLPPFN